MIDSGAKSPPMTSRPILILLFLNYPSSGSCLLLNS
jgi:hypothetical protein